MNKTLWDYCLENGWVKSSEIVLLDYPEKFMLINFKDTYELSCCVGPEYTGGKRFCDIDKSLPLDKQINLLNAFVEAYS